MSSYPSNAEMVAMGQAAKDANPNDSEQMFYASLRLACDWQRAKDSRQIKCLADALNELVSIVKIHSKATGKNFAWAELEEAEKALNACNVSTPAQEAKS